MDQIIILDDFAVDNNFIKHMLDDLVRRILNSLLPNWIVACLNFEVSCELRKFEVFEDTRFDERAFLWLVGLPKKRDWYVKFNTIRKWSEITG